MAESSAVGLVQGQTPAPGQSRPPSPKTELGSWRDFTETSRWLHWLFFTKKSKHLISEAERAGQSARNPKTKVHKPLLQERKARHCQVVPDGDPSAGAASVRARTAAAPPANENTCLSQVHEVVFEAALLRRAGRHSHRAESESEFGQ